MQIVLEQEEEVRHDVGGDEGVGEDQEAEGAGVRGGAGGNGVADENGGEGLGDGGTNFGGEGDGGKSGEDVDARGSEVVGEAG